MIPKPSSCIGCPFYKHGDYITPDHMVPGSKVLFIAQNPGPDEEAGHLLKNRYWQYGQSYDEWEQVTPQPLIGATGQLFRNKFLPLSSLQQHEVSVANAIRCRPGSSLGLKADELPSITTTMKLESSKADIVQALRHCRDAHLHIPSSVKTIVTMGRHAMFSLTGIQNEEREYGKKQGVVESWRGYAIDQPYAFTKWPTIDIGEYHHLNSDYRIMFTMHIAALFKGTNKRFYGATLNDFHKLGMMLRREWPLTMPTWSTVPPTTWPRHSAFDTEYIPDDNTLIRWSLCSNINDLYCVEADESAFDTGVPYIRIEPGSTVVIQNALADISHLANIVDMSHIRIEDMMLAHSVLWTGEPHGLNYIASKYGSLNRYKHLSSANPQMYSAMDAWEPNFIWKHHFIPQFKKEKASWRVYRDIRIPQINIINKAQLKGSRINSQRLQDAVTIYTDRIAMYKEQACTLTDDANFNLAGRKQMMEVIYD